MQEVEWDFDTSQALAIRDDPRDRGRSTGAIRDSSHRIEWVPLVWEYPEDYLPRFPQLLGGQAIYQYDETNKHVLGRFLNPDYSVDAVRRALKDEVAKEMAQRLSASDWMVIEEMETGRPMDPSIKSEREQIRGRMRSIHAQIENLPARKLPDFNWTLDPSANSVDEGV